MHAFNRRTDGRTPLSSQVRAGIPCNAEKQKDRQTPSNNITSLAKVINNAPAALRCVCTANKHNHHHHPEQQQHSFILVIQTHAIDRNSGGYGDAFPPTSLIVAGRLTSLILRMFMSKIASKLDCQVCNTVQLSGYHPSLCPCTLRGLSPTPRHPSRQLLDPSSPAQCNIKIQVTGSAKTIKRREQQPLEQ